MALDLPPRSLGLVITESTICLALNIASLVGNGMLCLAVFRNPRLRSTTNLYIVALSIRDLMCAVVEMPLTFGTLVIGKWAFGNALCQLHGFVDVFSTYCPPATMGLTAFNRYIRIVKTKHYRTIFSPWRSKLWLSCVWFSLAGFLLVARITNWQGYGFVVGFAACSVDHYTDSRRLIHYVFIVAVYFFVPLLVAIFSYYNVFKAIRQHNLEVAPALNTSPAVTQAKISVQEIKISKSIAFVMAGFFLCWMPLWSLTLTNRFSPPPVPRAIPLFVTFFVFLSSSINPLIYAATNRAFRQEFRKMLFCFKRRRAVAPVQIRVGTLKKENGDVYHVAEVSVDATRNVTSTSTAVLKVGATNSIF